jgi:hypothetical protein
VIDMDLYQIMLPRRRPTSATILILRHGIPVLLCVAAAVLIILGHGNLTGVSDSAAEGNVFTGTVNHDGLLCAIGIGCFITALMVWLFGWMVRLSIDSEDDRDDEQRDRDYFARTGRWPGERGPG